MAKKKAKPRTSQKPAKARPRRHSAAKPVKKLRKKKSATLGRPTVSQDEKLFLLFREDFHARQIFEFLQAETVRDLEQFSPEEIVRRLSQPIRQSVQRIRLRLAAHNRCLKDDEAYAIEHAGESPGP